MNLLIHAHPQFSYICRAIIEVSELNSVALKDLNVFLVNGPGFLNHMLPSLDNYLSNYLPFSRIIKSFTVLNFPPEIDPHRFLSFNQPTDVLSFLEREHGHHFQNLQNSVKDSLFRGLSPCFNHYDFHINQNSPSNQLLFSKRMNYASSLVEYYLRLMSFNSIEATVCSHGYYDFHVSFTIASLLSNCKSYIVAGGNRNSYEITSSTIVDFGSEAPFQELTGDPDFHRSDKLLDLNNKVFNHKTVSHVQVLKLVSLFYSMRIIILHWQSSSLLWFKRFSIHCITCLLRGEFSPQFSWKLVFI